MRDPHKYDWLPPDDHYHPEYAVVWGFGALFVVALIVVCWIWLH